MEKEIKTIKIYKTTKDELDKFKIHPRDTYDMIVRRLIEEIKKLNPEKKTEQDENKSI